MDMRIDKWKSAIFSVEEIDVITDAIESFLFKDFFESSNTILEIHCIADYEDEVLMVYNKDNSGDFCNRAADLANYGIDMLIEKISNEYGDADEEDDDEEDEDDYDDESEDEDESDEENALHFLEPGHFSTICLVDIHGPFLVNATILNFNVGAVTFYVAAETKMDFDLAFVGMIGLSKLIGELLAARDDSAQTFAESFPDKERCLLDQQSCDRIADKICSYLSSNKEAVRAWRNE